MKKTPGWKSCWTSGGIPPLSAQGTSSETMINADELLKPISDEKPCGEDLSYDQGFQELEGIMRGKPETQFSAAEDPDWKLLRERCLELWSRSKDMRLATALSLAALKMEGLPALREGLSLLKGMLERYWDSCFPLLDPADNNDPTQRLNIIAALANPVGTFGDPMRFLERLRQAPLAKSVQMGQFGLADILMSEAAPAGAEEKPGPTAAQVEAAFRDTKPEDLAAVGQAVSDSLRLAGEIDQLLTKTVGADRAPDLDALPRELKEIQKRLAPYLSPGSVPDSSGAEAGAGAPAVAGTAGASKPIQGEIQSREDVVRMINKLCDYYKREEPSSPVPNILKRAQRLAEMDFMQIISDLSPDAVREIQRITGELPKEG
jgi:type VI secretion system protein ImpA